MSGYDFDAYLKEAERCRSKSGNVALSRRQADRYSSMHLNVKNNNTVCYPPGLHNNVRALKNGRGREGRYVVVIIITVSRARCRI